MPVPAAAIMSTQDVFELMLRRLASAGPIEDRDRSILFEVECEIHDLPARASIVEEGAVPQQCCLVLEGVTSRHQLTRSGDRQIHAVQITGEIPDLLSLHLRRMDHSLRTLSACRLAFFPHRSLWRACTQSPALTAALWRETLIDAAIHRTSLLRIGRLSADERVAHLLCEMKLRFQAVDATQDGSYLLDMTQQEIGDLLALSFVSVNRAFRDLREEGLARFEKRVVEILDWDRLTEKAGFDPTYLHQSP